MRTDDHDAFRGVILGTALGDALCLPYEGLAPRRCRRLLPGPLRPRLLPGIAMMSDDTEHTLMVAQSLLAHPDDPEAFARDFSWRLRGWIAALPAGVGFATLRAGLKLWLGMPPARSGVWSAGNGPAMRAAVLGVCLGDSDRLRAYVRACTRLTHTDPRAERGALAVALAAHHARRSGGWTPRDCLDLVRTSLGADLDPELAAALDRVEQSLGPAWRSVDPQERPVDGVAHGAEERPPGAQERSPRAEEQSLGGYEAGPKGVSGFVYSTVPAALAAFLRHPSDFRACLEEVVDLGGDTDTVGAIAGAIAGASLQAPLPADWLAGLRDWPRTTAWMTDVADRLRATFAEGQRPGPAPLPWWGIPPRNAAFAGVILAHGFRRLAPPY